MRSVKSSVKGWKTAGTRLAVLIVISLQTLGLRAGSPQEPAEPRLDEEMAKQEKIYGSRGADVPSGYVTGRTLSDCAQLLPSGFCDALGSLGSSHRWLDVGADAVSVPRMKLLQYQAGNPPGRPVMHVFRRQNGKIFHFWGTELSANHVDTVWPYWNLMDITPEGRPDIPTPPQNFRSEFLEKNYLKKE